MITKNYKVINAAFSNVRATGVLPIPDIKDINGNIINTLQISGIQPVGAVNNSTTYFTEGAVNDTSLWVGTSTIPATDDDFSINAIPTSSITSNEVTSTRFIDVDKIQVQFTRRFTALTDLTINEVALTKRYNKDSGGNRATFLLAREVLTTPKTVNAGETFTVSMVIEM